MASNPSPGPSATDGSTRARGRGKSRGGLGKYLRARGRGRGRGRPAEFTNRLVLEDEEEIEIDPESEEAKQFAKKYSKRQLGSNADRYLEPEPDLNSDGEVELEPEVDLSAFLERQRLDTTTGNFHAGMDNDDDDDDVDHTLAHLSVNTAASQSRKGKVQQIDWNEELTEMSREKAIAEANSDLKARFRANVEKQRNKPTLRPARTKNESYVEAPALPTDVTPPSKAEKEELEDFLDDLLG